MYFVNTWVSRSCWHWKGDYLCLPRVVTKLRVKGLKDLNPLLSKFREISLVEANHTSQCSLIITISLKATLPISSLLLMQSSPPTTWNYIWGEANKSHFRECNVWRERITVNGIDWHFFPWTARCLLRRREWKRELWLPHQETATTFHVYTPHQCERGQTSHRQIP